MQNPSKDKRGGRLGISLSEREADEIRRLAAEESARQGRIVSVSEFVRLKTLGDPQLPAAA